MNQPIEIKIKNQIIGAVQGIRINKNTNLDGYFYRVRFDKDKVPHPDCLRGVVFDLHQKNKKIKINRCFIKDFTYSYHTHNNIIIDFCSFAAENGFVNGKEIKNGKDLIRSLNE